MLAVQIKRRTYFTDVFPEDKGNNKGGYYGEVYNDMDGKDKIDVFTIDKRNFPPDMANDSQKRAKALKYAKEYVERVFK